MKGITIGVLLGVTLVFAAGCRKQAAETTEVKVGVNLPLSDKLAPYGKGVLDGVELRVKQINDAGGINGRQIVLVVEDNKGEKVSTRNAFKKLSEIDRVVAVIGPITSTNALAAKMDAERDKVPMISPTATNDTVTANTQYVFRACFNDWFQGKTVANYAIEQLGLKTAAIMTDRNSDYSKGLSASFSSAFQAGGGQVLSEEGYQQNDTDFGAQLVNIKNSGAQIIFVPGYPPEVPLVIKQAKIVGFAGRLCGADGWDNEAVIAESGDNIEGCFLVGAFSPEDDRPLVKDFVRQMQAATGRMPGTFEALGYDSVLMLAQAIGTNGPTREGIRQGLGGIKNLEVVTGQITINSRGDAEKNAAILKITKQDGKYVAKLLASVTP